MDSNLVHVYDAAKRREYYLKTRKLKGRKHAAPQVKPPVKTRAQRQAERRKKLEAEVNALKSRLEKLRNALDELTKQAKARSGVKPTTSSSKTSASGGSSSKEKPLTPAQKAKKAAEDKKYREKNKDQQLDDQVKSLKAKIKTIQERIAKMRKDGSLGAKRNSSK